MPRSRNHNVHYNVKKLDLKLFELFDLNFRFETISEISFLSCWAWSLILVAVALSIVKLVYTTVFSQLIRRNMKYALTLPRHWKVRGFPEKRSFSRLAIGTSCVGSRHVKRFSFTSNHLRPRNFSKTVGSIDVITLYDRSNCCRDVRSTNHWSFIDVI